MLEDREILKLVAAEKAESIGYRDEIGSKRETLLDYYNLQPFGDEIEGRSKYISSDVSDVVEGMLPSLIRVFTQGRNVARFIADNPNYDAEAEQKTELANYVFYRQNQGVLTLTNMFKDALLQYTGVVKVTIDESTEVTQENYQGLSGDEFQALQADEETELEEVTEEVIQVQTPIGIAQQSKYDAKVKRTKKAKKKVCYENIPPEEFLISRTARDFVKPQMIGHTTPKTRSELIEMGFDREIVDSLPTQTRIDSNEEKTARYHDYENNDLGSSKQKATDLIELSELYMYIDADEDGIAELWQIFEAGDQILEKNKWDEHPFCCVTPIPIPHRAIGTCPADQVADVQLMKSTLVRNMADNIYSNNFNRYAYNDRVNVDDLLNARPGGTVEVEGEGPIGDAVSPLVTVPQVDQILAAIEYVDSSAEKRTGFTRFSQGLDADALNHTATGFKGISDYSQQRMEMIARLFAETGVRDIFRKTIALLTKYQDEKMQIRVSGQPLEIDPTAWRENMDCFIDVGLGTGDRNEKIINLNNILMQQKELLQLGSPLVDTAKIYNTLDKLITEIGLKDVDLYFNDTQKPIEILQAQNEIMAIQLQQMQQQLQMQNPLAEAEQVKQQTEVLKAQLKAQQTERADNIKATDVALKDERERMKMAQDQNQFEQSQVVDLTKIEADLQKQGSATNVPGSAI
jgi:hypothetical protein